MALRAIAARDSWRPSAMYGKPAAVARPPNRSGSPMEWCCPKLGRSLCCAAALAMPGARVLYRSRLVLGPFLHARFGSVLGQPKPVGAAFWQSWVHCARAGFKNGKARAGAAHGAVRRRLRAHDSLLFRLQVCRVWGGVFCSRFIFDAIAEVASSLGPPAWIRPAHRTLLVDTEQCQKFLGWRMRRI